MKIAAFIASAVSATPSAIGLGGGLNCDLDSIFDVTCTVSDGFQIETKSNADIADENCKTLLTNSDLEIVAVPNQSGYVGDCVFNGFNQTIDILANPSCYSGSMTNGYGLDLDIYQVGETDTVYSTYNGITCSISPSVTVNTFTLTINAPSFDDITEVYTENAIDLEYIADGSTSKTAEFGSEVAVYAELSVASHFDATLEDCLINGVSPSAYDYGVTSGSEQANTTAAVNAVTDLVSSEIIYFTAVENITISGCSITLAEL